MNPPAVPPSTDTGLIAWLEETRIALPLRGVEAHFELTGDLLDVEIDQIYHQNHAFALNVIYSFPLPSGAAVYRCEIRVNERIVSAKIVPLEEARRIAATKKAEGYRTALVETVRDNLFELNIGNLAPGDIVVIRLAYLQSIDRDGGPGEASFRIPMTPGVRYIPGVPLLRRNSGAGAWDDTDEVPDASRISPPRIDALHSDAAYCALHGKVHPAGWEIESFTSPSHPLIVRCEDGLLSISLVDGGVVPDRDVVLRMRTSAHELERFGWSCKHDGHQYGLVRLVAPSPDPQATEEARDFFFLVDRSGSMAGVKWRACVQAFREFLRRMGPLDRACVTFFADAFQDLAERPLPAGAILVEPEVTGLEQMPPDGGTNLLPALRHALEVQARHRSPEREPIFVVITDGQVGNEEAILELLSSQQGKVRVYTFGIDHAVNDAFLRRLAEDHGGKAILATPEDDIPGLVSGVARKLGTAVVRNLRVESPWEAASSRSLALWQGDAAMLPVRTSAILSEVVVVGNSAVDGAEVRFQIPLRPASGAAPRLLWQRERISSWDRDGHSEEATKLACEANLLSRQTAFVAWDEAERVMVPGPHLDIYQPSFMPAACMGVTRPMPKATVRLSALLPIPLCRPSFPPAAAAAAPPAPMAASSLAPLAAAPSDPLGWQAQLPTLLDLDGAAAIRLTDWLEQWLWAEPEHAKERQRILQELIAELRAAGTAKARIDRFSHWVDHSVEPPIREAIQRALDAGNPAV
jgi:Ca-activated chloride channel family protein